MILVFAALAAVTALVAWPLPGQDHKTMGIITDIGPLNTGKTSTQQRATVEDSDGRGIIVDVASYPACHLGSPVVLHRRRTLLGTNVSLWPEGCR